MEQAITREILRNELQAGERAAIELLFSHYGSMLYAYILQFAPERPKAENLLITIFSSLGPRLEDACNSTLSVYCWLQVEARKIILGSGSMNTPDQAPEPCRSCYSGLLQDASPEQQRVFRELFVNGRRKEDLARLMGKDVADIDDLLRDSLQWMRKRL
ncbi:MAG: hypothetical protein Q8927_21470 [Bacteroidota bacterium]|nr:hypothetical protein [Bacteroidota bacterium]MDP4218773.1 hypothetical protein [Bacteroidota bacterium]MDP4245785.1 hypothetical protein [Bacteroidota bacterium]MDP4253543.1 hypothetical protein [Bacteroidota bacterium]MDP4257069.1 hypothetical protein [Bacteroidota bacterium]